MKVKHIELCSSFTPANREMFFCLVVVEVNKRKFINVGNSIKLVGSKMFTIYILCHNYSNIKN